MNPWPPGPDRAVLDGREAHVWRVPLDVAPELMAGLAAVIGPEEAERAARCRVPRERRRFVAAHGALRSVLAGYLGFPAAGLRFGASRRGRPYLTWPPGGRLDFNLSHSADVALIAVARGRRVGVDVERIDPAADHVAMARRFLAEDDARLVAELPVEDARRVFFTRWTWRESYAKALDVPVARRLDDLVPSGSPVRAGPWALWDLPVGPPCCATLAVPASFVDRIRLFDFYPGAVK